MSGTRSRATGTIPADGTCTARLRNRGQGAKRRIPFWPSLSLVLLLFLASGAAGETRCGVERWAVKVGTDPSAHHIDAEEIHDTTIAAMRMWKPPDRITHTLPRQWPQEMQVWRVSGTLIAFKAETDSDYHLVLRDEHGHTMIAEIPSPTCARHSLFAAAIIAARADFTRRFAATARLQHVRVPVTVTGPAFFDLCHGQTGRAPNCVEIHPVLSISLRWATMEPEARAAASERASRHMNRLWARITPDDKRRRLSGLRRDPQAWGKAGAAARWR